MDKINIKEAGLNITQPRIRILKILETSDQKHFSAEDLYQILSQNQEGGTGLQLFHDTIY